MPYTDLRDFISQLERKGDIAHVTAAVSARLEITEIADRVLRRQGPALLFENVRESSVPVLANLFGTVERIAMAMGQSSIEDLRNLGAELAILRQPEAPTGLKDAWDKLPLVRRLLTMAPKFVRHAVCLEQIIPTGQVDLGNLPVQTCWPDDAGKLITWGLVVTRGPEKKRENLGIYRQQVIGRDRVIMRWLEHRGGALDYLSFRKKYPRDPFPVAVVLGADPATLLAAVCPIPDDISEYAFAGLLRGRRTELIGTTVGELHVPANAEIVMEGHIYPDDEADEGPFGDHTGYYNEVERFPVLTIERITTRNDPIYHSTYTGRPPDEPAILGAALNELFVPLLSGSFPEIVDFYLPPEGCSYRVAIASIRKEYPGHARRIMMGIWSVLKQFTYTKYLIVTDDDINVRDWNDVIWAIATRADPGRDTTILSNTPVDYLDFASPEPGLGSKLGIDATNKWPGETRRRWGHPIAMTAAVKSRIDALWPTLGLGEL